MIHGHFILKINFRAPPNIVFLPESVLPLLLGFVSPGFRPESWGHLVG